LFVGALPRPRKAVDVDDMVVGAGGFEDQGFKVTLKEDMLHISLLAPGIVLERDHGEGCPLFGSHSK
jgi:hypothetical protein